MRTIWLAVIAVALGAGTSLHAQEVMKQKMAYQPTSGSDADAWAVRSPYAARPVQRVQAVADDHPPAALGAPVAPIVPPAAPVVEAPAMGGGCAGGCGRCGCGVGSCACQPSCCEKLLAWLCFKKHHCCCQLAHCCHVPPVYLFFIDECTEGVRHEYPPCHCDLPGIWHGEPAKGPGGCAGCGAH